MRRILIFLALLLAIAAPARADYLAEVGSFSTGTGTAGTTVEVNLSQAFQPKAIFYWWSGRTESTDAIGRATHRAGYGAAVSTSSRATTFASSTDAAGFSNASEGCRTDAPVAVTAATEALDGLLDLNSLDADGFTMIVDDQFTASYRINFLTLGGSDLTNASIGTFTEPAAIGDQDITGVGFQPDAVIIFSDSSATSPPHVGIWSNLCLGFAAGSSIINQTMCGNGEDNKNTSVTYSYHRAGEAIGLVDGSGTTGTVNGRASVTQWLSNGFRLNWAERTGSRILYYLALKGGSYIAGDLLTQTDTTSDIVESAFGFQPVAGLFMGRGLAQSTADNQNDHNRLGIGAFNSTTSRLASSILDEDNLGTTEVSTAVEYDEVYVNISLTSTINGLMDIKSVDSGGFTCIMDDADPAQAFVSYLAFGPGVAAAARRPMLVN